MLAMPNLLALQQSLKNGIVEYHLLVFEK